MFLENLYLGSKQFTFAHLMVVWWWVYDYAPLTNNTIKKQKTCKL